MFIFFPRLLESKSNGDCGVLGVFARGLSGIEVVSCERFCGASHLFVFSLAREVMLIKPHAAKRPPPLLSSRSKGTGNRAYGAKPT